MGHIAVINRKLCGIFRLRATEPILSSILNTNPANANISNFRPIKQETSEPSSKKIKKEMKDDTETQELEKTIAKQNKDYFKTRDALKKSTEKSIWVRILERNKQAVPSGKSEV